MRALLESMRWYGPNDPVSLADIRQAGARGVVTALHHIPNGDIWPLDAILERKTDVQKAGLRWAVVESVPIHEDIKTRSGNYKLYIENYKKTIENLAAAGIAIICYNFMPVLDWTRTDLSFELADGAQALRFELKALAAFDLFILQREGADKDYHEDIIKEAEVLFRNMDMEGKEKLQANILAGLPGSEEGYSLDDFRNALQRYRSIGSAELKENLSYFLNETIPVAEKSKLVMAIHPDDPPYSILGLPRVVGDAEDLRRILNAPHSPSNGITFCTGSFGVREDNDLVAMVREFANRIYFIHLRSISRDQNGDFYEASHLEGEVPMYQLMQELMTINDNRSQSIPMRPDHGHQILDDLQKSANPGYSAIGRLKGLAELRGLMYAIKNQDLGDTTK